MTLRDVVAGLIAILLLAAALSLATTLQRQRRRRQRAHDSERALGRTIIAEIPSARDLVLFSEDSARFYYGDRPLDKDLIVAVRVLINGTPIAEARRSGARGRAGAHEESIEGPRDAAAGAEHRPEGIARDRWDVAIETVTGTTLVECGAIRERVSQELARAVFDAVRQAIG
jgi:hypothetical protein